MAIINILSPLTQNNIQSHLINRQWIQVLILLISFSKTLMKVEQNLEVQLIELRDLKVKTRENLSHLDHHHLLISLLVGLGLKRNFMWIIFQTQSQLVALQLKKMRLVIYWIQRTWEMSSTSTKEKSLSKIDLLSEAIRHYLQMARTNTRTALNKIWKKSSALTRLKVLSLFWIKCLSKDVR